MLLSYSLNSIAVHVYRVCTAEHVLKDHMLLSEGCTGTVQYY